MVEPVVVVVVVVLEDEVVVLAVLDVSVAESPDVDVGAVVGLSVPDATPVSLLFAEAQRNANI